jgi:hypothetical protein
MSKPRDDRRKDLLLPALDQIIDMGHPLVRLAALIGLAKRNYIPLRQSYLRLAKRAAIMVGRYTHAHQFKRVRRQLKFCGHGLAGSSATSAARLMAMRCWKLASARCSV